MPQQNAAAYLMLDISAVVEDAQDFDYCHSIVHGIEDIVHYYPIAFQDTISQNSRL